jgi:alanyl-tRNA synthetase
VRAKDIRSEFLSFFKEHEHTVVPSSSLIPHNDPTLFFVNAGMVQFKDVFTGAEVRDYSRATTVQKCLRVSGKHNDLENVGRTPRHHTFFEMLGNFSFGDYFKTDAIPMAWDLLTNRLGIDGDRLWVTVFETDDEAYQIWADQVGFPTERIQRLGAKDNFWSMGETGPCGPCSEIHYDHGAHIDPNPGGPATESDRYVEIWNLVFMQYEQSAEGRSDLPQPSIDTGAGLERIAAILQGKYTNYDTDVFAPLLARASELSGHAMGKDAEIDTALRVISDHARATAFLVSDGVMPSNEGRGYVLRRVMRRGVRFGVKVGIDQSFLHRVTDAVIDEFSDAYPALGERRSFIEEVVRAEEDRFRRTLDRGMRMLDTELDTAGDGGTVPGDVAFTLSDTYGFPLDLTQQIAEERGVGVDADGFKAALDAQRARGRAAWKGSGEQAVGAFWTELASTHGATEFTGYDRDEDVGTILALLKQADVDGDVQSSVVPRLETGEVGIVLLDKTPFYGESGGQVGDAGRLGDAKVTDTRKASGLHLHEVIVGSAVSVGDVVEAHVDGRERDKTRRNHTATHLLHAALRDVLGTHVSQKGSLVGPDRLRFDFAHHKSMSAKEIRRVEDQVNHEVLRNTGLTTELKDLDSAIADGAMALFGEKYDHDVRVVSVPGYSVELCGGTHCGATGDIGLFRVVSEGGIAAGVRRIEAQTGTGAIRVVRGTAKALDAAAAALKTQPERLVESIQKLMADRKELEKTVAAMKAEVAKDAAGSLVDDAREIGGVKVLAVQYDGDLREQADRLRDQLGSALVVLIANRGKKVQILVGATKDIAGSRVHAGKILGAIAPLVDGRGGGRPDMAQGGGSDASGIPAALAKAIEVAEAALG